MKKKKNTSLKVETYKVPTLNSKTRLQDLAAGMFERTPTKSGLKKAIKNNLVRINDRVATSGSYLLGGETIDLYQNQEINIKPSIDIQLDIIYEDEYLSLVNKPAGITVSGNKKWTLENALSSNLKKSSEPDALSKPEPIHRLDHPTSGIILIGKTSNSVIALNQLFRDRNIDKTYYAVTINKMESQGNITSPIDNKTSSTNFIVEQCLESERFKFLNLVHVFPHTGRKHQIRKHLSELGNPILGDQIYCSNENILKGNGLYLHAFSLNFTHPFTKEKMYHSAPLPKKFTRLFPSLKNNQ